MNIATLSREVMANSSPTNRANNRMLYATSPLVLIHHRILELCLFNKPE